MVVKNDVIFSKPSSPVISRHNSKTPSGLPPLISESYITSGDPIVPRYSVLSDEVSVEFEVCKYNMS